MNIVKKSEAPKERFNLTNINTVEIGNLSYWEGNRARKGTLYCRQVLGVMLPILQGESGEGEIAMTGDFTINGRSFNAKVEGENDKYFNIPEPIIKACEHSDLFVTISAGY